MGGRRHPVVLAPAAWPAWLGEEPADEAHLKSLLAPYSSDGMMCWPVSPRVVPIVKRARLFLERESAIAAREASISDAAAVVS